MAKASFLFEPRQICNGTYTRFGIPWFELASNKSFLVSLHFSLTLSRSVMPNLRQIASAKLASRCARTLAPNRQRSRSAKQYEAHLHGLRGIAALMVYIGHNIFPGRMDLVAR
jgi:hypothetical protein